MYIILPESGSDRKISPFYHGNEILFLGNLFANVHQFQMFKLIEVSVKNSNKNSHNTDSTELRVEMRTLQREHTPQRLSMEFTTLTRNVN